MKTPGEMSLMTNNLLRKVSEDEDPNVASSPYLFNVHVVQVVLDKLDGGVEVSLIELVGDVPSQRPILPPLLHRAVEKGHSVQHGLPLHHVADIQKVLVDAW